VPQTNPRGNDTHSSLYYLIQCVYLHNSHTISHATSFWRFCQGLIIWQNLVWLFYLVVLFNLVYLLFLQVSHWCMTIGIPTNTEYLFDSEIDKTLWSRKELKKMDGNKNDINGNSNDHNENPPIRCVVDE